MQEYIFIFLHNSFITIIHILKPLYFNVICVSEINFKLFEGFFFFSVSNVLYKLKSVKTYQNCLEKKNERKIFIIKTYVELRQRTNFEINNLNYLSIDILN